MKKIMNEQLSISNLSPLRARYYDYQHFTYPLHFHSEYEIIYIKESCGMRFVGNNFEKFNPGDILLIGSNLPHYLKSDEKYFQGIENLRVKGTIIQFEKEFMQYSISNYPQFRKIKHMLVDSQLGVYFPTGCSAKLLNLVEIIPVENGIDQITSFLQLLKVMSEIPERKVLSTPDYINDLQYDSSRIDKVFTFLNQNYTRQISLEEISSLASMNPAAFCRFFKRETGKSLMNFILDMRIGYACKLLLMNERNISQISSECGFETISHFNKKFKLFVGHSPSEYRKIVLES